MKSLENMNIYDLCVLGVFELMEAAECEQHWWIALLICDLFV